MQRHYILIVILCGVLCIPFLGSVHLFDWDEINFAECAREMLVTGNYFQPQIDFQPFWEKPPLFIWCQVLCMKVFGINEFSARLPNAIIGWITLLVLFRFGTSLYSDSSKNSQKQITEHDSILFGWFWVIAYGGSFLPHFYFHSGIIDPMFNLFIFLSLIQFWKADNDSYSKLTNALTSGVFCGIAILTKGPVAGVIVYGTWKLFYIIKHRSIRLPYKFLSLSLLAVVATCSIWFGVDLIVNGSWFISSFIEYQIRLLTTGDAGHSGPWFYHIPVLLLGCFPASFLALRLLFPSNRKGIFTEGQEAFLRMMVIMLCLVVILFSIVQTKIVHYSSLAYYPISYLSALSMLGWSISKKRTVSFSIFVLFIAVILGSALVFFPIILSDIPRLFSFAESIGKPITNEFTSALLRTPVQWNGFEWISGIILIAGSLVSVTMTLRKQITTSFFILFGTVACTLFWFLTLLAPRIEEYTQATPIQFYQAKQTEQCFVQPVGFKSYAHLFYNQKKMKFSAKGQEIPHQDWESWLLNSPIPFPAYFVLKQPDADDFIRNNPELREIQRANGWVFYKRESTK
jgi:4-amino-4-deoxy-L-arabinose transferase-like glycosyltransferase